METLMALKFSEMIALRTNLALSLEASFDNYSEDVVSGFTDYLAPRLEEGEAALDVRFQLVLLRRCVEHHRHQLEDLDGGVVEQAHGDEKNRAELELRTEAVDAKLRQVRSACRGFYGLKSLGRVGLRGEFPRSPVRLHHHAMVVKASLENPEFGLQPLLEVDLADAEAGSLPAQLAAQLDPELRQLGDLVDGRHNERKKSTNVRLQRRQVIREFDFHIRGIVRMAQGMFRLAGRDDLGKRMRPLLKRVLRKLGNPQPQQDADPKDEGETQTETTPETTGTEATATEPSQAGRPTSQPAITA